MIKKPTADGTKTTKKKVVAKKTAGKKKAVNKTAVVNKTAAQKAPVSKQAAATKPAVSKKAASRPASNPLISPRERYEMIATMAYYRAEKRKFAPGNDERDWYECEKIIDEMLTKK